MSIYNIAHRQKHITIRAMAKPRSHARADDSTQISISLPKSLLKQIDALAKEDGRTRSNWIARQLTAAIQAMHLRETQPRHRSTLAFHLNEGNPEAAAQITEDPPRRGSTTRKQSHH
jgi:hypothetical protein